MKKCHSLSAAVPMASLLFIWFGSSLSTYSGYPENMAEDWQSRGAFLNECELFTNGGTNGPKSNKDTLRRLIVRGMEGRRYHEVAHCCAHPRARI